MPRQKAHDMRRRCKFLCIIALAIFAAFLLTYDFKAGRLTFAPERPIAHSNTILSRALCGNTSGNVGTSARSAETLLHFREQLLSGGREYKCKKPFRAGSVGDGGWWMCEDRELPSECTIFSIGIAGDYSFDLSASKRYGCNVYSFDPTVDHEEYLDDVGKVRFTKIGAAGNLYLDEHFRL